MNSKERIQFSKEAYDAGIRYQSDPLPQIYTYEGLMACTIIANQRRKFHETDGILGNV